MADSQLPPGSETPEEQKERLSLDFLLGVFGSIAMNLIIFGLFRFKILQSESSLWLPWALNFVAILILAIKQRGHIVLGILASYGLGLAIVMCLSLATCFGLAGGI